MAPSFPNLVDLPKLYLLRGAATAEVACSGLTEEKGVMSDADAAVSLGESSEDSGVLMLRASANLHSNPKEAVRLADNL